MIHKFRMFLLSVSMPILLMACSPAADDSSTEESKGALADSAVELTEASADEASAESENNTMVSNSSSETDSDADASTATDVADSETTVNEGNTDETDEAVVDAQNSQSDAVSDIQQLALDALLAKTHLEKEGYSYFFQATDSNDFIEIEVREILDEKTEHMTREGMYRYVFQTDEVLVEDYLTGDFIPYEQ